MVATVESANHLDLKLFHDLKIAIGCPQSFCTGCKFRRESLLTKCKKMRRLKTLACKLYREYQAKLNGHPYHKLTEKEELALVFDYPELVKWFRDTK